MKTLILLALAGLFAFFSLSSNAEPPALPHAAPFRLIFKAYDGDPKNGTPVEKFSFQIGTLDLKQPSDFHSIGHRIPNTHFKLISFVFKEAWNAELGEKEDVSELTIANELNGKTVVLQLNKVVDASTSENATK